MKREAPCLKNTTMLIDSVIVYSVLCCGEEVSQCGIESAKLVKISDTASFRPAEFDSFKGDNHQHSLVKAR